MMERPKVFDMDGRNKCRILPTIPFAIFTSSCRLPSFSRKRESILIKRGYYVHGRKKEILLDEMVRIKNKIYLVNGVC